MISAICRAVNIIIFGDNSIARVHAAGLRSEVHMMHRESYGIFLMPQYNKSTPAASNEQCRQQGGGPVHDVVIWKRDGAGGCQNLLARNVWKMLAARTSAKFMVGYEFGSVSRGGSDMRGMWTMLSARSCMVMISFINRHRAVSQKCIRVPWFVSRNAPTKQ